MANHPPFDTLILCATPRTGSTLLCSLLAASGVAGLPASWYRREDRDWYAEDWALPRDAAGHWCPTEYLHAAKSHGSTPNGVFGLRIMWQSLGELLSELSQIHPEGSGPALLAQAFGRFRIILLHRQDTIAQAVSRLKAEQSGHWHTIGDWEERFDDAPGTLTYDAERISAYRQEAEDATAAWRDYFEQNGLSYLPIVYENLSAAPVETVCDLLQSLGLPCPEKICFNVENQRLTDSTNLQWATRYRAEMKKPGQA